MSGSGTDYDLVYPLYAMGVEVASHTLSHKFPHTWWASASYQEYVDEIEGMRRRLTSEAGVPYDTIKGGHDYSKIGKLRTPSYIQPRAILSSLTSRGSLKL